MFVSVFDLTGGGLSLEGTVDVCVCLLTDFGGGLSS